MRAGGKQTMENLSFFNVAFYLPPPLHLPLILSLIPRVTLMYGRLNSDKVVFVILLKWKTRERLEVRKRGKKIHQLLIEMVFKQFISIYKRLRERCAVKTSKQNIQNEQNKIVILLHENLFSSPIRTFEST